MSIALDPTPEQSHLVDAVREVLAERFPRSRLHRAHGVPADNGALREIAALGWFGVGIPEEHGGAGCTVVEEVLLVRALGRHLVTPSVLASILAAHHALARANLGLATEIVSGDRRVCLGASLPEEQGREPQGLLYDAEGADLALLLGPPGPALLPLGAMEIPAPRPSLDKTVSLRRVTWPRGAADNGHPDLGARADLLVAAQLLGLAEGALETAVDYAKVRHQFGQPIGAFQAIKHRCADMKTRVAVLSAQVLMAALSMREERGDAPLQIAAARFLAARSAIENAAAGIQIHGGMGFTAECDAHLFLLRAHLLQHLGSSESDLETRLAGDPLPDFA